MPLYFDEKLGTPLPVDPFKYRASLWESMKAEFDWTLDTNPAKQLGRIADYYGFDDNDVDLENAQAVADYAKDFQQRPQVLSDNEQMAIIKAAGMEQHLKPDPYYTEEILKDVINAKSRENVRAMVQNKDTAANLLPNLLAGFAGGFLDPVAILTSAIPIAPGLQARWVQNAATAAGRFMARAGYGAISGAAGAAMTEPAVYTGQKIYQAEYDLGMSLQNMMMGALMGGAMHAGAGLIKDYRQGNSAMLANMNLPKAAPTAQSKRLYALRKKQIAKAYINSGVDMTQADIDQAAAAAADIFDNWALQQAHNAGVLPEQIYYKYRYNYQTGEIIQRNRAGKRQINENKGRFDLRDARIKEHEAAIRSEGADIADAEITRQGEELADRFDIWAKSVSRSERIPLDNLYRDFDIDRKTGRIIRRAGGWYDNNPMDNLWRKAGAQYADPQANTLYSMYKNRASTVADFAEYVNSKKEGEQKSYYDFNGKKITRSDGSIQDSSIRLAEDRLKHASKHNLTNEQWEFVPEVIEKGEVINIGKSFENGNDCNIYIMSYQKDKMAVIASNGYNKKNESYLWIETAFIDNPERVNNWIEIKKRNLEDADASQSAGGSPAHPSPAKNRDVTLPPVSAEESLAGRGKAVNAGNESILKNPERFFEDTSEAGRARLLNDLESWRSFVDETISKKIMPDDNRLMISQTPLIFKQLEKDNPALKKAAEGGVYASGHLFEGKHSYITPEILKQLPEAVANPVAIFKNIEKEGVRRTGDYIFLLDLDGLDGNKLIAPVAVNIKSSKTGKNNNIVLSLFKKEKKGKIRENWYKEQFEKNLIYYDKSRTPEWTDDFTGDPLLHIQPKGFGYQLPENITGGSLLHSQNSLSTKKIVKIEDYVKGRMDNERILNNQNGYFAAADPDDLFRQGVKSALRFTDDDTTALIRIFKGADKTTALHEMSHIIRRFSQVKAMGKDASARQKADYLAMCKFAGAEPGEKWTRAQEEKWAAVFEKYYFDNELTEKQLAQGLNDIKEDMRKVYTQAQFSGADVSPEISELLESLNKISLDEDMFEYRKAAAETFFNDGLDNFKGESLINTAIDDKTPAPANSIKLMEMERAGFLKDMESIAGGNPEMLEKIRAELAEIDKAHDPEIAKARAAEEIFMEFAACEANKA